MKFILIYYDGRYIYHYAPQQRHIEAWERSLKSHDNELGIAHLLMINDKGDPVEYLNGHYVSVPALTWED